MKQLHSANNPALSHWIKLATQSRARQKTGETLLEGLHLIQEFLHAKSAGAWTLVVAQSALEKPAVRKVVDRVAENDCVALSDPLFSKISSGAGDNAVLAVVGMNALANLYPPVNSGFQLWLDRVQDPGNVGAIIRTAAASGANAVMLSAGCADPWSPKCLRAAMGGHFRLHVGVDIDLTNAIAAFKGQVLAAAAHESSTSVFERDMTGSVAVVLGNEGDGIADNIKTRVHGSIRIPMSGTFESLNVSAAAAVIAFEIVRQRSRQ